MGSGVQILKLALEAGDQNFVRKDDIMLMAKMIASNSVICP